MNTILYISCIVISIIIVIGIIICDYYWRKKAPHNFPIKYRGKVFWFSRSVAVSMFLFGYNKEGKKFVLANIRGSGTPDFQGFWNAPCGYLDFGESGEEAAQRETYEETGIFIDTKDIKFHSVNSDPKDNSRQNVTLRYVANLNNKTIENVTFDTSHSEKNEVSDVRWLPIENINDYNWAFGHNHIIKQILLENK